MNPEIQALKDRITQLETLFYNHRHKAFDRTKELDGLLSSGPTLSLSYPSDVALYSTDGEVAAVAKTLLYLSSDADAQIVANSTGVANGGDIFLYFGTDTPTNATNGFVHLPTCNGVPTGTPAHYVGNSLPFIYDRANENLYVYHNGWKKTTTFT